MANILLAEDAIFMRTIIQGIFDRAGHALIASAANGKQAVERYAELRHSGQTPDLAILDITMPEMDGMEAARRIQAAHPEARFAFISSLNSPETIERARAMGACGFIAKPFAEADVIDGVARMLRGEEAFCEPRREQPQAPAAETPAREPEKSEEAQGHELNGKRKMRF